MSLNDEVREFWEAEACGTNAELIGVQQPRNLAVVVMDNEHYGETGMQATHTRQGVDLAGIAKAAGFRDAGTIYEMAEVRKWSTRLYTDPGPLFAAIKVTTAHGWFAARPSGTENVYKLYAESFRGGAHLRRIQEDAQAVVRRALAAVRP